MPEHRPGRIKRAVAGVAVRHGAPAADSGFCGIVVKTLTPPQDAPRADLDLVAAGEGYNLIITGVVSVPLVGLEAAVEGDLVYIATADNTLSLAPGAGKVVLGKLEDLAGQRGGPADRIRVNLDKKVA